MSVSPMCVSLLQSYGCLDLSCKINQMLWHMISAIGSCIQNCIPINPKLASWHLFTIMKLLLQCCEGEVGCVAGLPMYRWRWTTHFRLCISWCLGDSQLPWLWVLTPWSLCLVSITCCVGKVSLWHFENICNFPTGYHVLGLNIGFLSSVV